MSTSEYPAQRIGRPRLSKLPGAVAAKDIPVEVWITAALVLVAAVIRIIVINNQSLWEDEALTAYETRIPFGAMINTVLHVETTPPLYFVVIWIWAHLFGTGEVALRSVSTLAGIALVPVAYLCARDLISRWAGVVGAALVALNPFLIWYSQEARSYMLVALLTALSFLWFIRARRDPSARNLGWWAGWSALALMTHFFAGFLVAPEALWLLWLNRTRVVVVAVAVVALVQAAMLPFAGVDTTHGAGWIHSIPKTNRIADGIQEWGVSILFRRGSVLLGFLAGAIFVAVVALLLLRGGDERTRAGAKPAVAIVSFVVVAPMALAYLGQDYWLDRNLIPAFVPLAVVVAAACVAPRARLLGGAFAIALLAMFSAATAVVQTDPSLLRPNWRVLGHAIGPTAVPRAIVAVGGSVAQPLKIYVPHAAWVEPPGRKIRIDELDLVARPRWLPPIRGRHPFGARFLGVRLVNGSAIDRFGLRHPISATVKELMQLAPWLFRDYRGYVIAFFQRPGA